MIPESHPLQQICFRIWWDGTTREEIGIRDPQIVAYVSHLLAEFCEAEQLFKIRRRLEPPAGRRWRDADGIRSGLWSRALVRSRAPGAQTYRRLHALLRRNVPREHQSLPPAPPASGKFCGLGQGRARKATTSFPSSSTSSTPRSRPCSPASRENFEECVYGLNMVKNDLEEMQHPIVRRTDESDHVA